MDRKRILIISYDQEQFSIHNEECNTSYDLRVGSLYRDHRDNEGRTLSEGQSIELLPGQAVIIETEEEVQFPRGIFGHILPKVSLLQKGIANTPSKVDPGYSGHLLITAFNHGKQTVHLKRRERFCSLYLLSVDGDARPYNKGGKQILGGRGVKHWRDNLEVHIPWLLLLSLGCGLVGAIPVVIHLVQAAVRLE
jgi:deoxycytidine triphosphate deaminase